MRLEVRNLQNQETFSIGPEGMTFGREGGPADVRVADQSVSKRHAKVYERDGTWFLEDLKSVNGTVVNSKRITEPIPLTPGFVFALSKHKFEIVRIEGDDLGTAASMPQKSVDSGNGRSDPNAQSNKRGRANPPPQQQLQEDYEPPQRQERGGPSSGASGGPASHSGPEPKGVGYFFVAVPKAVAYYMAAIPLLALNPVGTTRKSIQAMRFMPMGKMELIAYALPALFFTSMCSTIATVFAAVIIGGFGGIGAAIGAAISGIIVGAISAIIGAAIVGFFGDQVLAWIIKLLKGQSDARARTNYFIAAFVAQALVAVPGALAIMFTSIVARLASKIGFIVILNAVPALVQAVASVVLLFVFYSWWSHFNVMKWVSIVLKVLMILTALGGAYSVVMSVVAAIGSIGSGGSGSGQVDVGDMKEAQEAQEAAAKELKEANEALAEATKAGDEKAIEAAKKAMEAANATATASKKAGEDAKAAAALALVEKEKLAEKEKEAGKEVEKVVDAVKPPKEDDKVIDKQIEKVVDKPIEKLIDKPVEAEKDPVATKKGGGSYADYFEHKTAIEKAIEADPTLLLKSANEDDYAKLLKCLREQDARPEKKSRDYDSALEPLYKRKTEAKQFQACGETVNKLAKRLGL